MERVRKENMEDRKEDRRKENMIEEGKLSRKGIGDGRRKKRKEEERKRERRKERVFRRKYYSFSSSCLCLHEILLQQVGGYEL